MNGDKQNIINMEGVHIVFHPKFHNGKLVIELWGRGEKGASYKINFTVSISWISYISNGLKEAWLKLKADTEDEGKHFK